MNSVVIDDTERERITRQLLTRTRLEASAYPDYDQDDHLRVYLEDIDDEHWPVLLAVIVDTPDVTAAVQTYLTEHFPGSSIPPLTVVRR